MSANNLKKQFKRLENMETAIFQQIQRYQNQIMKDLSDRQSIKYRQEVRKQEIKKKAPKQLITNPNNNGVWVQLANFIDEQQFVDLNQIQKRKREREEIRQQMERKRVEIQARNEPQSQVQSEQFENFQKGHEKIPWKLMRELRRKQVAENKARLQRIQQNKKQKVSHYHKY